MSLTGPFPQFRNSSLGKAVFCTVLLLLALVSHPQLAHAATTWNVTPSSACTLEDAISASTNAATAGSCAAGTSSGFTDYNVINLAAGTYTIGANLPNIYVHPLAIVGAGTGSTVIDGQNTYTIFSEGAGAALQLSNMTIERAGGASNIPAVQATNNSVIQNVVIKNSTGASGLDILSGSGQTASVNNVAIFGNTHSGAHALYVSANGGTVNITNTTLTGSVYGLDITGVSATTINVTNVTSASNSSYGAYVQEAGGSPTVNIKNTILANSGTADCGGTVADLTSQGHNIVSDNTCGFVGTSNHTNTNPGLGALTAVSNTDVFPITYTSPAYDSGDSTGAPSTDQRGVSRPQCSGVDIGAYETTGCTPAAPNGGSGTTPAGSKSTGSSKGSGTNAAASSGGDTSTSTTSPTTTSDTTNTNKSNESSSTDQVAPIATKKSASHAGMIWTGTAIVVAGVGAGGWFYLDKHPKLLAKLLQKKGK